MDISVPLFLELGAVLVALSLASSVARRWGLSPVPLYLLAGLALGEGGVAPVPAAGAFIGTGAAIGMVLLLLLLGLEFSPAEFSQSLRLHLPSSVLDAVLNALPGAAAGLLLGLDWRGALALAGITWISSSGIVARLINDLGRLGNRETPSVLSLLVLEDIAMAVYLPLLGAAVVGSTLGRTTFTLATALLAVAVALFASRRLREPINRILDTGDSEQFLLRILGLTLLVAGAAEAAHASAAVGAFLVGLALSGQLAQRTRVAMEPLRDLFSLVFFLAIGLTIDPRNLVPILPAAAALAAVTALTKTAVGFYAAGRDGVARRGRLRAGTVLIPRGEFSVVIAGLAAGAAPGLVPFAAAYVIILAVAGPVVTYAAGRMPTPVWAGGTRNGAEA
ncbi:cation:proton antiporter [Streptomonospora salina]|uniref:CPA2 family monovalent cation:H+ antiporter-2 n=1 Tax=Streptomonospora salina TaxID=104205 RepID=A0A841E1D3_9ACTN|nr:cation:proton antiporter [Streptomonospora salina]MBB5996502.1 CPA2 family monovalent cation:H+ antiporter-2 [Streptomonospora salina]